MTQIMKTDINKIIKIYNLSEYELSQVPEHEGGRNLIFVCKKEDVPECVLRISLTGDRTEEEYLAETEFVHFLAKNKAAVTDVIPSVNGKLVERMVYDGKEAFVSCFSYASGMLISDNGYQYRDGAPLSEYFYNTGKVLGKIHQLSKGYAPTYHRQEYFDKYNMDYIDMLISDDYLELKAAIDRRFKQFATFNKTPENYGLVHFDYSDGNYHVDMSDGKITVFDFDNCMFCWYMFDLANLWTHGVGWFLLEQNMEKRKQGIGEYFETILEGYRSETDILDEEVERLPLYIDMVLIENIVDEFECCRRAGEKVDYEDIEDAAECLIHNIPYTGFVECE